MLEFNHRQVSATPGGGRMRPEEQQVEVIEKRSLRRLKRAWILCNLAIRQSWTAVDLRVCIVWDAVRASGTAGPIPLQLGMPWAGEEDVNTGSGPCSNPIKSNYSTLGRHFNRNARDLGTFGPSIPDRFRKWSFGLSIESILRS